MMAAAMLQNGADDDASNITKKRKKTKKKFALMLTKREKAYSSSCSQTVHLSPAISSQFILGVCAAAEDRRNQ